MGQQSERIEALDALRGFALLGILVVNIQVFSGWGFLGTEGRDSLDWSTFDSQIHAVLKIVAHDKFYSLFSLLFGYSFVLMARNRGAGYHLRRLLGLAVFGFLHGVFLWPWDILLLYATVGVLLTPFIRCTAFSLLFWFFVTLSAIGFGRFYLSTHAPLNAWNQVYVSTLGTSVREMAIGSYLDVVQANVELLRAITLDRIESLRPVRVMAMFLLGSAAARWRLAEPGRHEKGLRTFVILGLPLAMLVASIERIIEPTSSPERMVSVAAATFAGPLTAAVYAAGLITWWNGSGRLAGGVRRWLAPAGRMALTNYLAQSAIFVPLFYGFGGGLFAEMSLAMLMLISAGVFSVQLLVSRLWLALCQQGPMEWLWRWQIQGSRPRFFRRWRQP